LAIRIGSGKVGLGPDPDAVLGTGMVTGDVRPVRMLQ